MNFMHFKSFLITADHKSITSAAKALYITPASLMQQINLLEDNLGFKVFCRSNRGVTLTKAGERLYGGCSRLLNECETLLQECREIANADDSLIRVSVARPYHLVRLGERYQSEHPDIRFEFDRIDPLTQENMGTYLTKGDFDVIQTGFYSESSETLPYDVLLYPADRFCCVCSSSHPFAQMAAVPLQLLDGMTLYTYSNFSIDLPKMEKYAESLGVHFTFERALYSERTVLKCCANNGVYILEEQAAQAFSYLSAIPIEPRIPCYVGIAYLKNAKPAVQDFVCYVREHMNEISQNYPPFAGAEN